MGTKKNIIQMGKKGSGDLCALCCGYGLLRPTHPRCGNMTCAGFIEVGEEAAVPSPSHGVNGRTSLDESSQRQGYYR